MKQAVLIFFSLFYFSAFAQVQDPNSPGFDMGATDSSATQTDGSAEKGDQEQVTEQMIKAYERIFLNVDSVTNLITYIGVIEQEESPSDSLYMRAKKWSEKQFGGKPSYDTDKKNQKIVVNGYLPAYSYSNKYTKRSIGRYNFKMTIWIKEGRYRYAVSNLVHEGIKGNAGEASRNYFEYYYTTTTNVKGYDQILRYADRDLNNMIRGFVKAMKDPVVVDEEDW